MRDFCCDETEKGPVESKKKDEYDINDNANSEREIAVVDRNRWDPINQDRVIGDSGYKPQEERLGWLFIDDDEEERNKRDPGKKREVELGSCGSSQQPGQYGKDEICFFELQITILRVESCPLVFWRRKEE